ncbi:GNAT family N-acetyltransferase [Geodermatophilus sp. SYSU D01176]
METSVVDVPDRGRFEIRLGDRVVGLASYHVENGSMALPHTEVDPSVGGRGIGSALVAGVLAAARERGLTVLPYCSFVRHYIQQHPEYVDLVAEADRPHFGLATAAR